MSTKLVQKGHCCRFANHKPPFPSGHTWCIVWRLWGALFFAHCTDHPMQAQNPSYVKSNPKWKWHARGQQAHRATPWTWRLAIDWGKRRNCWQRPRVHAGSAPFQCRAGVSTVGFVLPPPWMELSWIARPQNWQIFFLFYKNVLQGRSGRFYLGPRNTASSSNLNF